MKWQVFLSYSREQYYAAELIALNLQQRGITVWFDVQQLEPGSQWKHDINDGLEQSGGVLLLASRASLASPHVKLEWQYALDHGRPLIVALLEQVALPPELSRVPLIDGRGNIDTSASEIHDVLLNPQAPVRPVSHSTRYPDVILRAMRAFFIRDFARIGGHGIFIILALLALNYASVAAYIGDLVLQRVPHAEMIAPLVIAGILLLLVYRFIDTALHPTFRRILRPDIQLLLRGPRGDQSSGFGSVAFTLWLLLLSGYFPDSHMQMYFAARGMQPLPIPLLVILLGAIIACWVLSVVALRVMPTLPHADVLRFIPLGQAPEAWREQIYGGLVPQTPVVALESLESFRVRVVAAPHDRHVIRRLRPMMTRLNGEIVPDHLPADRCILVLSHASSRKRVAEVLKGDQTSIVPVIVSGFALPDDLQSLKDLQLVDYSNRNRDKLWAVLLLLNPNAAAYLGHLQPKLLPVKLNLIKPSPVVGQLSGNLLTLALLALVGVILAVLNSTDLLRTVFIAALLLVTHVLLLRSAFRAREGRQAVPRMALTVLGFVPILMVTWILSELPAEIKVWNVSLLLYPHIWPIVIGIAAVATLDFVLLRLSNPHVLGDGDALGLDKADRPPPISLRTLGFYLIVSIFVVVRLSG